ncbi:hypothetical protein ACTFIW_000785 [Dictyostelium discoideum]
MVCLYLSLEFLYHPKYYSNFLYVEADDEHTEEAGNDQNERAGNEHNKESCDEPNEEVGDEYSLLGLPFSHILVKELANKISSTFATSEEKKDYIFYLFILIQLEESLKNFWIASLNKFFTFI